MGRVHVSHCRLPIELGSECGRRKSKRREGGRGEDRGGKEACPGPRLALQEPNKRSIVSSLAAKAHDLLVARDRGREGEGRGTGSGNFVATFLQLQLQRATIEMHINMRFLQCLHIRLAS